MCGLIHIKGYEDLIRENLNEDENYNTPSSDIIEFSAEGLVNVEEKVQIKFANMFEQYKNKLEDNFEYACSSCERLHTRSNVTQYTVTHSNFPLIDGKRKINIVKLSNMQIMMTKMSLKEYKLLEKL